MERVIIGSLGECGIAAGTIDGLTGVWTVAALSPEQRDADAAAAKIASGKARKIGSIGIHISRGVTTHGFAVNVNNDLQPFEWIVPCGIEGCRMTSFSREVGAQQDFAQFAALVARHFSAAYERRAKAVEVGELARSVPAAENLAANRTSPPAVEAALP
jgi:lipoyl(octanoyl) transferase